MEKRGEEKKQLVSNVIKFWSVEIDKGREKSMAD